MVVNYEICVMKILVVAATHHEIESFAKPGTHCETLVCGVGIPSTIYHLTQKLSTEKYDLVIQAGIAGSFSNKMKLGHVVAVSQDTFADIGAKENKRFKTLFELGLEDENLFPFQQGWLINTSQILQAVHLKRVTAVTVNKIHDCKKQNKSLKKQFAAEIESMEGAAFHFVCLQQKIPFIQLRSISNSVGERDKTKWDINTAIENLGIELTRLIDSINKS